jgi:rhodanese-related sulfurtransferase
MKTTTTPELKARLGAVTLIDVRTPAEFTEIHIPGSRLVPLHELNEAKAKEVAGWEGECVIICRSGNRAKQAAEKLTAAGAKNITVLEGGVTAWESGGQEVNRGQKTISIERQVRIAAGALVVTGVVLGAVLSPWFVLLSGFVGCGLIFAGLTDWCGMGLLLARMPWNNRAGSCCAEGGATCAR